jgi:prepilin-type N-terminal cleavage/methylation domain-containing protein
MSRRLNIFKDQSGMTLIEVMIAVSVLCGTIFVLASVYVGMRKQLARAGTKSVEVSIVNNVIETVRNNPGLYQVDYDTTAGEPDLFLDVQKLPWVWNQHGIIPAAQCHVDCDRKFGYMVWPLTSSLGTRGLYDVLIRIKRSNNPTDYYDVEFIVGTK